MLSARQTWYYCYEREVLTNVSMLELELSDHVLSPSSDDSDGRDTQNTGHHAERLQREGQRQDTQADLLVSDNHKLTASNPPGP